MMKGYLPVPVDDDGNLVAVSDKKAAFESEAVDRVSELEELKYLAGLIICQTWVEKGKQNKQHFEGFFTHEKVNETHKGAFDLTVDYSKAVFPAMCHVLLGFLMLGNFAHMRDVASNKVRDGINLKQLVENVGKCYGMKSPKYYHVQYLAWLDCIRR